MSVCRTRVGSCGVHERLTLRRGSESWQNSSHVLHEMPNLKKRLDTYRRSYKALTIHAIIEYRLSRFNVLVMRIVELIVII